MAKIIARIGVPLLIVLALVAFFMPAVERSRESSRRTICKNRLKQIGIALHSYHDEYGMFPPAYTVDAEGNKLHSWRTLILPYMEQTALYKTIDLTKPWDDPVNAIARETVIPAYYCPSGNSPSTHTNYLAILGDHFAFASSASRKMSDFLDGLNETVIVMETPTELSVEWMSPIDTDEKFFLTFNAETSLSHAGFVQVLFGDRSVKSVANFASPEIRGALLTISGGEHISN